MYLKKKGDFVMPSLKKPAVCDICDGTEFEHLFKPEQWVCSDCEHIQVERNQRNDPNKCRKCDAPRGSKPFKKGKNLCLDCQNAYMRDWAEKNAEHVKKYRSTPEFKKRRQASVRKSIQKSPKAFLTYLMGRLTKDSSSKNRHFIKAGGKRLSLDIDFDFLWGLWESQRGLCALSGVPMLHEFNNLCSISVDRVDSELGYVRGNVQLVCKWVNLAKGKHSNAEFGSLLRGVGLVQAERLGARPPVVVWGKEAEGPFEVLCVNLVDGFLERYPLASFDMMSLLDWQVKSGSAVDGWWLCGVRLKRGSFSVAVELREGSSLVRVCFSYPKSTLAEYVFEDVGVSRVESVLTDKVEFDLDDPGSVGDIRGAFFRFCLRALQPGVGDG
jgi:hypothetical protein